jgi:hypothetical protein
MGKTLKKATLKKPKDFEKTIRIVYSKCSNNIYIMDKTLLAWVAGMLDGEGSLAIKRITRKLSGGRKRINYQLWVVVGMAEKPANVKAIDLLHKTFGGNVCRYTPKKIKPNHYPKIAWTVVSQQALNCLKLVRPYLVIKKPNADLLIDFQETCISRKSKKNDIEKLKKQESFFYELRKVNETKKFLHLQRLSEETPKGDATV